MNSFKYAATSSKSSKHGLLTSDALEVCYTYLQGDARVISSIHRQYQSKNRQNPGGTEGGNAESRPI